MKKYVALLRGINVGGNNKIAMTELKNSFESIGYKNVSTYINSGNVFFESSDDESAICENIEMQIEKDFGINIRVIVRDKKCIEAINNKIPETWRNDAEYKTDVMFLWPEYENEKSLELVTIKNRVDTVFYLDGAIVWHLKKSNYSKSGMNKLIGTEVYKNMTVRNVNTVRKLLTLMNN